MTPVKLRMNQAQHTAMMDHLLPADKLEAVLVALCGRRTGEAAHCLSVHAIVPIPYSECKTRTADRVTWSTRQLVPLLEKAALRDMAILKVHSHPNGYGQFSEQDDAADRDLFASIYGWTDISHPHASAVMLPDGELFGRVATSDGTFTPIESIGVIGDDLRYWKPSGYTSASSEFTRRHAQMFGAGTITKLRSLSVAVVGCSGTGSPVVEMLARLGVGKMVLVDPDHVEEKNLNRIVNATRKDALARRPKVELLRRAIRRMGLDTKVVSVAESLVSRRAVEAVGECDVVFGCMDSIEGRNLLNRLATFYCIPYFDIGVKLVADGRGGISEVCGAVHYVKPGGESLLDRKVYTLKQLKAEGLRRTDRAAYEDQVGAGYIDGVQEDRPAVISINFQLASTAVNEFLARLHPYRLDENAEFAVVRPSFMHGHYYRQAEGVPSQGLISWLGRGDSRPLLNMPELSQLEIVA